MMRTILQAGMLGLALMAGTARAETPVTMIVMDGSGSMWGQIDGRPKLQIARETVAEVLGQVPDGQELGLLAYGHREKGNCSDIELIVAPAAGTAGQISAAVGAMRFLGKTPLSDAVRQAAEALRFREEAATVVLVTDGLETCSADPCALGRELEAAGLNFTAHVIGFGLSQAEGAQVACLAEGTGGRYLAASDAGSLAQALQDTVAAPAALPEAPKVQRSYFPGAPMMADIALVPTGGITGAPEAAVPAFTFPQDGSATQCAALCEGEASCSAWRHEPAGASASSCLGYGASIEMDYTASAQGSGAASGIKDGVLQLVRPYVPVEPLPQATLDAPASAPMGQSVAVGWTGPAAELDTIEIGLAGDGERWTWAYVASGNPVSLLMPGEPGVYELRYRFRDQAVIATRGITVTEAAVTMTTPDRVRAGAEFAVYWTGPDADYDNIQIAETGSDSYLSYGYVRGSNPLLLSAPEQPGPYELRYMLADTEVIAVQPFTVVPADAAMTDTEPLPIPVVIEADDAGMGFSVAWSAVPVPGQDLPPEAWAMPESLSGPVAAEFLPGIYDVTGDAGDQVFFGRIEVTEGGETRFAIPLSPERSPAGEDHGALTPTGPVPLQIKGVYDGAFASWEAFPLDEQNSQPVESGAPQPGVWEARLDPGPWLIRGRHEGAAGATYLAVIEVAEAASLTIERPSYSASATPEGVACTGPTLCLVSDQATGLRLALPAGWGMETPFAYETAGGAVAHQPSTLLQPLQGTAAGTMAALNPRQWDAMLGPCEPVAAGLLCRTEPMDPADLRAVRILAATAEIVRNGEGAAASETGGGAPALPPAPGFAASIKGTALTLPEGLNPLEILAPQLLTKE